MDTGNMPVQAARALVDYKRRTQWGRPMVDEEEEMVPTQPAAEEHGDQGGQESLVLW